MTSFKQTRNSGSKFEAELHGLISRYSRAIWRNIRVETLLTQNGLTEIDLLFCFKDLIFVVEAKNVSSIMGDYGERSWSFVGATSPGKETREYSSLNVITQNNIHVRSLKDLYFAYYGSWPAIVPCIVVPNGCRLGHELASTVYTLGRFDQLLSDVSAVSVESKIQRKVAAIIPGDGSVIYRPDFVLDEKSGRRVKGRC